AELLCLFRLSLSTCGTSQHLHGARGLNKNFSDVTGDAVVVVPATGTELPLDVNLRALTQIFTSHLRELAEQHHAMPFRLLPHLPCLFVAPAFRRGQLQVCHCAPVGGVTDFRIFSQASYENDLVNATNCHNASP